MFYDSIRVLCSWPMAKMLCCFNKRICISFYFFLVRPKNSMEMITQMDKNHTCSSSAFQVEISCFNFSLAFIVRTEFAIFLEAI